MVKIRVHELAKEYKMSSKQMAEKIQALGYPIKGYMSTLEDYEVSEIRRRLNDETGKKEEQSKGKKTGKVIKRRPKKVHIKIVKKADDERSGEAESDIPEETRQSSGDKKTDEDKETKSVKDAATSADISAEGISPPSAKEESVEKKKPETDSAGEKKVQPSAVSDEKKDSHTAKAVSETGPEEKGSFPEAGEKSGSMEEKEVPVDTTDKETVATEVQGNAPEQLKESSVDEKKEVKAAPEEAGTDAQKEADSIKKTSQKKAGEKEKGKKKKRASRKKKKTAERPEQFAKVLDIPRIELPPTQPVQKRHPKPKRKHPGKAAAAKKTDVVTPNSIIHEKEQPSPAPGKGRKKSKRVVRSTELDTGRRRRVEAKRTKGRRKSIDRILAEEAGFAGRGKKQGKKAKKSVTTPGTAPIKTEKRKFAIYETIQPVELAKKLGVKVGEVIMKLMGLGVMATATQSIDFDTAVIVASEFGYEVEKAAVAEDIIEIEDNKAAGDAVPRPPVVTVMGHVDHGKTSLLDAIRSADVVSGEAGGITQHIGAYEVTLESGSKVVFLDTPGHEAFTSMRARGASVTDIVIIVVAADDGVMAQTREAIDHSRAADVPIIIAINKIDKPGADPSRVKRELADLGLVPEDWGGDTIFVEVSAREGTGIDELLELMTLQAELLELSAVPDRSAKGHVIESRLDKGRGAVATLLVQEGTLKIGDALVCGIHYGKIRAMLNDKGERVESAGPSIPVEIQGLSGVPDAGNEFVVLPDEKKAREVASYRQAKARESELVKSNRVSLDSLFQKMKEDELKSLKLLVKADVQGSLEAVNDALAKLSTEKIKVEIVRGGIGAITESDVLLASASEAIIIGFNVKPGIQARQLAEQEHVDIRFYDVIYHALEEIKSAMTGLLEPVYKETELGRAEVRDTFHISKVGTIAGSYVVDGVIRRSARVRLLRDNVVVFNGDIKSLKRFKDDVKEVQSGYECGIGLERFNDIKIGDIIEAYELEEVAPDLGTSMKEQESSGDGHDGSGSN